MKDNINKATKTFQGKISVEPLVFFIMMLCEIKKSEVWPVSLQIHIYMCSYLVINKLHKEMYVNAKKLL